MNRKLLVILSALMLLCLPQVMGQGVDEDDGYNVFTPREVGTRNTPAGTVNEPGSQLLFLLEITALHQFSRSGRVRADPIQGFEVGHHKAASPGWIFIQPFAVDNENIRPRHGAKAAVDFGIGIHTQY